MRYLEDKDVEASYKIAEAIMDFIDMPANKDLLKAYYEDIWHHDLNGEIAWENIFVRHAMVLDLFFTHRFRSFEELLYFIENELNRFNTAAEGF